MSYSIDFVNNKLYGADDINGIRSMIMTDGVIKKGEDDCLVTLLANGIRIAPGEALYNDGCRIEVTEAEIIPHNGSDCYVYFDRNYYAEPKADKGDSLPENCIPLAKISGGKVVDLRSFATLKIPAMMPNRYMTKEFNLDFSVGNPLSVVKEVTFEDRTDIRYFIFANKFGKYETKLLFDYETGYVYGVCYDNRVYTYTNATVFLYNISLDMNIIKQGNKLTFYINSGSNLKLGTVTVTAL